MQDSRHVQEGYGEKKRKEINKKRNQLPAISSSPYEAGPMQRDHQDGIQSNYRFVVH